MSDLVLDTEGFTAALDAWAADRDKRCNALCEAIEQAGFTYTATEQRSGGYDWVLSTDLATWSGHASEEYECCCSAYETAIGALPKDSWPQPKPVERDFMVEEAVDA